MSSVCLYFQIHQPLRLRPFSYFQVGREHDYFDAADRDRLRRVVETCYLPLNAAIGRLVARHDGRFRVAFSISGTAIEQLARYAPEAIESFVALAETGAAEFLAETYYHSLASMYDAGEFRAQVHQHAAHIEALFGRRPLVFRNTRLIYSDRIGALVEGLGFQAVVADGAEYAVGGKDPHHVYLRPGGKLRLLLTDHRLSDELARGGAGAVVQQLNALGDAAGSAEATASDAGDGAGTVDAAVVNLSLDYASVGHGQVAETVTLLDALADSVLAAPGWDFLTPSQAIFRHRPAGTLECPRPLVWADSARELAAWQGNHMQQGALRRLYDLGPELRRRGNPVTMELWRKLQTSDHFDYMAIRSGTEATARVAASPYPSPYDAFINYMNVVTDLSAMVGVQCVDGSHGSL